MTFLQIKEMIALESVRGFDISKDDEKLKKTIPLEIKNIAKDTLVTQLITLTAVDSVAIGIDNYFIFEDGFYYREPREIIKDNDILDIDESLIVALVSIISLKYTKDEDKQKQKQKQNYHKCINLHNDTLQTQLQQYNLEQLINPYSIKYCINGETIIFNNDFIQIIDDFLSGSDMSFLSKQYREWIDLFADFANNQNTAIECKAHDIQLANTKGGINV